MKVAPRTYPDVWAGNPDTDRVWARIAESEISAEDMPDLYAMALKPDALPNRPY